MVKLKTIEQEIRYRGVLRAFGLINKAAQSGLIFALFFALALYMPYFFQVTDQLHFFFCQWPYFLK